MPSFQPESVKELIEDELNWESPQYQAIARLFVDNTAGKYEWDIIGSTVCFWHMYAHNTKPNIKKAGVFPAALEYFVGQAYGFESVTRSYLSEKYNISEGTITQRTRQLIEFAEQSTGRAR